MFLVGIELVEGGGCEVLLTGRRKGEQSLVLGSCFIARKIQKWDRSVQGTTVSFAQGKYSRRARGSGGFRARFQGILHS